MCAFANITIVPHYTNNLKHNCCVGIGLSTSKFCEVTANIIYSIVYGRKVIKMCVAGQAAWRFVENTQRHCCVSLCHCVPVNFRHVLPARLVGRFGSGPRLVDRRGLGVRGRVKPKNRHGPS